MNLDYVQNFDEDEKLRRSREKRHLKKARIEAKEEGHKEEKIKIAKELILDGMKDKKISKITKLTEEEIKNIRKEK